MGSRRMFGPQNYCCDICLSEYGAAFPFAHAATSRSQLGLLGILREFEMPLKMSGLSLIRRLNLCRKHRPLKIV